MIEGMKYRVYLWDIVLGSVACEQSRVYQAPDWALEALAFQVDLRGGEPQQQEASRGFAIWREAEEQVSQTPYCPYLLPRYWS